MVNLKELFRFRSHLRISVISDFDGSRECGTNRNVQGTLGDCSGTQRSRLRVHNQGAAWCSSAYMFV